MDVRVIDKQLNIIDKQLNIIDKQLNIIGQCSQISSGYWEFDIFGYF